MSCNGDGCDITVKAGMLFWPNAIVQDEKKDVFKLITYDTYASYEDAKAVIADWEAGYGLKIISSWIDVYEGDKHIGCLNHDSKVDCLIWYDTGEKA